MTAITPESIKGTIHEYRSIELKFDGKPFPGTSYRRTVFTDTPEGLSPAMRTCPLALFFGMGDAFMSRALTVPKAQRFVVDEAHRS